MRALAAKVLTVGIPGPNVDADAKRIVGEWGVGGVILFKRNIDTPQQTHGLIAQLRALRSDPLLLCVDQEGGRVQRMRAPLTVFPPMRRVHDVDIAEAIGRQLARELLAVGFDLNYAPVVDVDTNVNNPVIGDRSFSRSAEEVSTLACALIKGMQSEGVWACAKHFPGHGDTHEDSHHALPSLAHAVERLRAIEWPPFVAAAKAQVASIMTAHVMFPALDATSPATLSKACLDVLRHELHFEGMIVSDDLEMKAIADRYDVAEAAVQAIAAGCDNLLICHTPARIEAAIGRIAQEAEKSPAFLQRLRAAAMRTEALQVHAGRKTPVHYTPAAPPSSALHDWIAEQTASTALDPTEALA